MRVYSCARFEIPVQDARLQELQADLAAIEAERRSLEVQPESATSRTVRQLDEAVVTADVKLEAAREKYEFTATIVASARAGALHLAHLLGLSGGALAARLQVRGRMGLPLRVCVWLLHVWACGGFRAAVRCWVWAAVAFRLRGRFACGFVEGRP